MIFAGGAGGGAALVGTETIAAEVSISRRGLSGDPVVSDVSTAVGKLGRPSWIARAPKLG
ncbi:hypothetical protein BJD99_15170 [Rhodococcus sp. 1163]|uniref:hypothetical protein n=1 Tax=unclassified Rhodococcus (in: high G+C Gram-positive bacteria) TaxID=192944 RepID=UPI000A034082|nr:hypothetical protein [Rhodococcus sp. 1163]ORI11907.1 hypothetical protein BJD99_15170 [Rhodococcus sp. 1163]